MFVPLVVVILLVGGVGIGADRFDGCGVGVRVCHNAGTGVGTETFGVGLVVGGVDVYVCVGAGVHAGASAGVCVGICAGVGLGVWC